MANSNSNIIQTVNQYGRQLMQFIRSRVNTTEDAEDVLQDVWFQLSSLKEIETIESVSGWLYRVAKNKIIDRSRKKRPELLEDFSFTSDDGEVNFKEILLADSNTPEAAYLKKIFWEVLMDTLDELPEKQRDVFVKNEMEDISLQEIADATGENIKTIISRKGYAVKYLRERLNLVYQDFLQH